MHSVVIPGLDSSNSDHHQKVTVLEAATHEMLKTQNEKIAALEEAVAKLTSLLMYR